MNTVSQQRICIAPTVPAHVSNPISVLLPNPTSGLPSRYIIQDGKLFEMQMASAEGIRSWFVGDTIQSDGSLYIITPMDPIFMCIPILDIVRQKKTQEQGPNGSEGRFLILGDIFESDQYTSLRHLAQVDNMEACLAQICTVQHTSFKTFRLDDELVMIWLKKKVDHLVKNFESIQALVDSIAYTEALSETCRKGKLHTP
ncbi:hypothetical protein BGZ94_006339 [Podila epigama]|nr:hypothetical protein BGZ94_006339 [Podila epigama]